MTQNQTCILLGPQRPHSRLPEVFAELDLPDGPIAAISAGWQEAEGDTLDVEALVGRPLRDLELYQRAETLFASHADLFEAYRKRQAQLKEQQRLYRLRLRHLMLAARQLLEVTGDESILAAEITHAVRQLRALDRHHQKCVESIHNVFTDQYSAEQYQPLAEHRRSIDAILNDCPAVIITGGNIVVLLNRLLLFGLGPALSRKTLVGWSAGAMVLSDRIVLFHDRLPGGRRDAEVLGAGLGIVSGHVLLPDPQRRIRRNQPSRLGLFSRRFSPACCALLGLESRLRFDDDRLTGAESIECLKRSGEIGVLHPA